MDTYVEQSIDTSRQQKLWSIHETKPFGILLEARQPGVSIESIPVEELRQLVDRHLLVAARGFKGFSSGQELERYSETWGPLLEWNFGKVLDVKEDPSTVDAVFDSSGIPLHWDAMFNQVCPKYIIFESVKSPGDMDGGRTTFANTAAALEVVARETRQKWRRSTVEFTVERRAHYGGTVKTKVVTPHPEHPEREVIRFNEPEGAAYEMKNSVTRKFHAPDYQSEKLLIEELAQALHHPAAFYAHPWRDGDFLFCDNYTLLHGREPFKKQTYRHLRRTQVVGNPAHRNDWHG